MHRYFVVEVKNKNFKPEFLGQLQGYVAACDMKLNTPQENPAIGLLVCRGKNAPLAKYLLGKIDMPIGISDYELLTRKESTTAPFTTTVWRSFGQPSAVSGKEAWISPKTIRLS